MRRRTHHASLLVLALAVGTVRIARADLCAANMAPIATISNGLDGVSYTHPYRTTSSLFENVMNADGILYTDDLRLAYRDPTGSIVYWSSQAFPSQPVHDPLAVQSSDGSAGAYIGVGDLLYRFELADGAATSLALGRPGCQDEQSEMSIIVDQFAPPAWQAAPVGRGTTILVGTQYGACGRSDDDHNQLLFVDPALAAATPFWNGEGQIVVGPFLNVSAAYSDTQMRLIAVARPVAGMTSPTLLIFDGGVDAGSQPTLLASHALGDIDTWPLSWDDHLYVITTAGVLHAFDLGSGAEIYSLPIAPAGVTVTQDAALTWGARYARNAYVTLSNDTLVKVALDIPTTTGLTGVLAPAPWPMAIPGYHLTTGPVFNLDLGLLFVGGTDVATQTDGRIWQASLVDWQIGGLPSIPTTSLPVELDFDYGDPLATGDPNQFVPLLGTITHGSAPTVRDQIDQYPGAACNAVPPDAGEPLCGANFASECGTCTDWGTGGKIYNGASCYEHTGATCTTGCPAGADCVCWGCSCVVAQLH